MQCKTAAADMGGWVWSKCMASVEPSCLGESSSLIHDCSASLTVSIDVQMTVLQ